MSPMKVCVIGAGSSGIAVAKILQERNIPFDCFEKGSGIGGLWRYQNENGMSAAYRSLHINTSREQMQYSDFPMPAGYPDFPHHSLILKYFESYVDHFGLRERVTFQTSVLQVDLLEGKCGLPSAGAMERDIDRCQQKMNQRYTQSARHTIQVDFYPYLDELRRQRRRRGNQVAPATTSESAKARLSRAA